jgi:phosphatidylethanolamine-binding protein (PEBP) family uncharacterized protein
MNALGHWSHDPACPGPNAALNEEVAMKTHRSIFSANVLSLGMALAFAGAACAPANNEGENPGTSSGGSSGTGGSKGTGGSSGGSSSGGSGGSSSSSGSGGSAPSGTGGSTMTGSGGSSSQGSGGAVGSGGSSGSGSGGSSGTPDGGSTSPETGGAEMGGGMMPSGEFTLSSPDFLMISNNRLCHKKEQTRSGSQTSPGLMWSGLPADTKSIAVSLKDRNGGTHWVMWDIPATVTSLPRDINNAMKPEGSKNSGAWYGPGAGLPYRTYEYRVWALKVPTLPGGCGGKACYPNALMQNAIAFKELLVVGTSAGTCPQ